MRTLKLILTLLILNRRFILNMRGLVLLRIVLNHYFLRLLLLSLKFRRLSQLFVKIIRDLFILIKNGEILFNNIGSLCSLMNIINRLSSITYMRFILFWFTKNIIISFLSLNFRLRRFRIIDLIQRTLLKIIIKEF